jgi:murein DD-endopeptidase MepM/ murein hydrolase activator NlpD
VRVAFFIISLAIGWMCFSSCGETHEEESNSSTLKASIPQLLRLSQEQFGIDVDAHKVIQSQLEPDQYLRDVLLNHGVEPATIESIAQQSVKVFDVRRMRAGRQYSILKDESDQVDYFVYEINEADYVVIDLTEGVQMYTGSRKIDRKEREVAGVIESSLFEAVEVQGVAGILAQELENIFAWEVDFRDLKKEDQFKVVYEEEFVNGISLGISRILAAMIEQDGHQYYAILFSPQKDTMAYFDQSGQALQSPFLRSPLDSVGTAPEEDEPANILPMATSHLGTYFAAEAGQSVYTIGAGEIIEMGKRRRQGNIVRIKHNATFTTQYQHLSAFAAGLEVGDKVAKGEEIGSVGQSGRGAQPQVCLRMWENGKERNPLSLKLNPALIIPPDQWNAFEQLQKKRMDQLKQMKVKVGAKSYVLLD